ncbi:hypothetical protein ICW40_02675 [Actinotalea ferrariae]|uniref:DUF6069 family protein n=1 Tax=Actinotalea ferrariae TaxID=1386098 RepID=UPI001C8B460F|nr:DUF6069 family protein [Actinotalea ferrariae]MBX9243708.1 hypothetical protein [Actinotalea ferrariae]
MSTTTAAIAVPTSRVITPARTALAAGAALVVNLVIFFVAQALGATFDVGSPQPVSALVVGLFSVVPLALAAVVVALVARRRPGFQRFAAWAGLAVALLTVAAPFTASDDLTTAIALGAMHVVVGFAWFAATAPTAPRATAPRV